MNTTETNQADQQKDDKNSSRDNSDNSSDEPPGGGLNTKTKEDSHWSIIIEGEWREVTGACSDFTDKLEKAHSHEGTKEEDRLSQWIQWHPRKGDDEEELVERTASQAKFEPDQPPTHHLEKSTTHLTSFREKIFNHKKLSAGLSLLRKASKKGFTAFLSSLGWSLGKIEEFLYKKVVLRTNPFYFDNSLISASFEKTNPFEIDERDQYQLKIKVHEKEIKDKLRATESQKG